MITISSLVGLVAGTALANFILKKGRRLAIIRLDIAIIIGQAICQAHFVPCFCIGRFITGFCTGVLSIAMERSIFETAPHEMQGNLAYI
jgi:predicted MFS family arabinose efflux permease